MSNVTLLFVLTLLIVFSGLVLTFGWQQYLLWRKKKNLHRSEH